MINPNKCLYPVCHSVLDSADRKKFKKWLERNKTTGLLSESPALNSPDIALPEFIPELAALEEAFHHVFQSDQPIPDHTQEYEVNPTLTAIKIHYRLLPLFHRSKHAGPAHPGKQEAWVLIWKTCQGGQVRMKRADEMELLILKIVAENISFENARKETGFSHGQILSFLQEGASRRILTGPVSGLKRHNAPDSRSYKKDEKFLHSDSFTLQWHLTDACDLHCSHCYADTKRTALDLGQACAVIEDLMAFCMQKHVRGHIVFTGGNPFLHPDFFDIYSAAAQAGFILSILGNPVSREKITTLAGIRAPLYYQVSLEGPEEYNDQIRGQGEFGRVIGFLDMLEKLKITSHIMLTLNKENMGEVVQLANMLRGKTANFTFNRLARVGRGSAYAMPEPEKYKAFLMEYLKKSGENKIMHLKDNLFNILLASQNKPLFGGCTGHGCGAAFNFFAVLPDGEVHACRKFPSPLGNLTSESLKNIYDSAAAQRYRAGPEECRSCRLNAVCRGCYASAYSFGLDIFSSKDPYCFY